MNFVVWGVLFVFLFVLFSVTTEISAQFSLVVSQQLDKDFLKCLESGYHLGIVKGHYVCGGACFQLSSRQLTPLSWSLVPAYTELTKSGSGGKFSPS